MFEAAHRALDEVLPGSGPLHERFIAWREAQAVPVETLPRAIASLAEDFRERTDRLFGLPDGEHIDFDLVTDEPWSGFNYYLGDLRSRVVINTDLPVLSTSLGHLVAHEAYPGHHTEHSRKEVGLVRRQRRLEETIFLVGTPQCLLAEGLADLGLEVDLPRPSRAGRGRPPAPARRCRSTPRSPPGCGGGRGAQRGARATSPCCCTTRAATSTTSSPTPSAGGCCRATGPRRRSSSRPTRRGAPTSSATSRASGRCRAFTAGDPARFERLLTEQLLPDDLVAA